MNDLNVIDRFMAGLHPLHRQRVRAAGRRRRVPDHDADRHRHHARRPVLGDGRRGRCHRPLPQEDPLRRRVRVHPRTASRRSPTSSSARSRRPGSPRAAARMTADDLLKPGRLAGTGFSAAWPLLQQVSRADRVHQLLRQFPDDRGAAVRLGDRRSSPSSSSRCSCSSRSSSSS